jgi:Ca2+-binding EF-hand superfamily protein
MTQSDHKSTQPKLIKQRIETFGYWNFKKYLKNAFDSYDDDGSGSLDRDELREFINELRFSLNLLQIDNVLFDQIYSILDEDSNGTVDIGKPLNPPTLKRPLEEFYQSMPEVLPLIAEQGQEMKNLLKKVFNDFDLSNKGLLLRKECKLLFDLSCDKIGVERCDNWAINYIISLIDENTNGGINESEFTNSYRVIIGELQKNKKVSKRERSERGGDFFRDELHKCWRAKDETKSLFMNFLGGECKKYQKIKANKVLEDSLMQESYRVGGVGVTKHLELVTQFSKFNAKTLVSLEKIINIKPGAIPKLNKSEPSVKTRKQTSLGPGGLAGRKSIQKIGTMIGKSSGFRADEGLKGNLAPAKMNLAIEETAEDGEEDTPEKQVKADYWGSRTDLDSHVQRQMEDSLVEQPEVITIGVQ